MGHSSSIDIGVPWILSISGQTIVQRDDLKHKACSMESDSESVLSFSLEAAADAGAKLAK
eukprot:5836300-Amphidinium_carterae.1